MKKLLALSGIGSSVAFWALATFLAPTVIAILLVLVMHSINPSGANIGFEQGSSIARDLVGFTTSFFDPTAGLSALFIGL